MSDTLNVAERLAAMDTDETTAAALRDLRPLVAEHISAAIDAAYTRLLQDPEAQQIYRGISLVDAKRLQREHWLETIFSGRFTDAELKRSIDLIERRQRSGLAIRWYFVFWSVVFVRLQAAIVHPYRRRTNRLHQLLVAAGKAVVNDLEIVATVHGSASQRAVAVELNQHADSFKRKISNLVRSVASPTTELHATAQSMSAACDTTSGQAKTALTAGEQTAGTAEAVAATTEQLTAAIQEIGRRVEQSTRIAGTAVEEAQRTDALVRGLVEARSRIGDVVRLIKDIASQTNLVALNATVEPARAGQAGKGFAVVAGEVKNLTNQTGKATDEIAAQIVAVQNATKDAVDAIQGIGTTIGQSSEIAAAIAAAVEQQQAATEGIVGKIRDVARSRGAANSSVSEVSCSAEQTGAAASQLLSGMTALTRESEQLSAEIDRFLTQIKFAALLERRFHPDRR